MTAKQSSRQIAVSSLALAALLATNGCSVLADAPEDDWRQVKAFAVVDRSELSWDVNRTCIGDGAPTDSVVVVRIRVGRALHSKAFLAGSGDPVHVGDSLSVNPTLCLLRARRSA